VRVCLHLYSNASKYTKLSDLPDQLNLILPLLISHLVSYKKEMGSTVLS